MEFVLSVISIIIIDLVLSGDNAAVISLAIKNLPEEQRQTAALIGAGGAVILRIFITSLATLLITIPYLNAVGGLFLLLITWNLLKQDDSENQVKTYNHFWATVGSIIIADLSMAFDNVMGVAGAAHGSIVLVIFGLAFSIPILIWGSNRLASLMNRYPLLIYIGAAVLVHTALNMLFHDHGLDLLRRIGKNALQWTSWGCAISVFLYGYFKTKNKTIGEED